MNPSASLRNGSSLLIVLAFVALLTGLVVAFFSRTAIDTQASNSSANGIRAELFSKGAVDTVIGDLKQEIAAGSTILTVGTNNVYLPLNVGVLQNSQPYPVTKNYAASLTLVKESLSGQPFYSGGTYPGAGLYPASNRASASVSTTASLNGRSISLSRWNKALLLPKKNTGSDTDFTPTDDFTPPDWIYVARDGSNPKAYAPALANPTNSNAGFVVGRYAYAVYDEAALLDMNAAGHPSGMTPAQTTAKGGIGLADLTPTGLLQPDIDALIGWRNYATAQPQGVFPNYAFSVGSALNYFNYLLGIKTGTTTIVPPPVTGVTNNAWTGARRTGFLSAGNTALVAGQTDRLFGSRQELIRMLTHDIAKSASDRERVQGALQYLGTFTREVNSPSWIPVKPAGSSIDYAANALAQAQSPASPGSAPANQIVPAVILTAQQAARITRADGTPAQAGEPLMKYRFPLRRLEWFNTANQATYAADILKWFAMRKSTTAPGTWDYVDPDTGSVVAGVPTIKTLDQVANAGREPTFWEVLQAAILSGSLGVGHGQDIGFYTIADVNPTRHLLQIGLNIIDQYNSNDGPTVLLLGATFAGGYLSINNANPTTTVPIAGTKNMPYIMETAEQGFQDNQRPLDPVGGVPQAYSVGYLPFLLWNPHQNASASATGTFRIRANGTSKYTVVRTVTTLPPVYSTLPGVTINHINTRLEFKTIPNRKFDTIDLIRPTDANIPDCSAYAMFPPIAGPTAHPVEMGFFTGQVAGGAWPSISVPYAVASTPLLTFYLEKLVGVNWIPCQIIPRFDLAFEFLGAANYGSETNKVNSGTYDTTIPIVASDPRTLRFGMFVGAATAAGAMRLNGWNLISATAPFASIAYPYNSGGSPAVMGPVFNPSAPPAAPADWAFNVSGSGRQYYSALSVGANASRMDQVVRMADGVPSLSPQGNPYYNASTVGASPSPARPLFLGRSFNSVAEMGYAFRDEPWKTLNFYSTDSADAALLDYFSLSEGSVRAGVVNVNAASPQVLSALLMGAASDANDTASPLNSSQANAIATAIRNYLGTTRRAVPANPPAASPADIALLTAQAAAGSPSPIPTTTSLPGGLKRAQEVVARSLADGWNTRTWNLLVDVVAQTGRFPATASNLDQFNVNGERRIWAHVAIDRFTGQVIDIQIEPVFE